MNIDYLILGHIAHDKTPHGPQLGGTVSYAAITAQGMGLRVGMLTSAHPGDPVLAGLDSIERRLLPAPSSTIFVNIYTEHGRVQVVEGHARRLSLADLPPEWQQAPIVHLGPIAQELDDTLTPERFPGALVGVTPQGYMRAWDAGGRVSAIPWRQAARFLPTATVTVLSEEDLGLSEVLEREYAALASRLVVTRAERGATLYTHGGRQDFPAPVIAEARHPTGAGDVLAGALLAYLYRHPHAWEAALRAAVTIASVFVERCADPGAPTAESMAAILADPRVTALWSASVA